MKRKEYGIYEGSFKKINSRLKASVLINSHRSVRKRIIEETHSKV